MLLDEDNYAEYDDMKCVCVNTKYDFVRSVFASPFDVFALTVKIIAIL